MPNTTRRVAGSIDTTKRGEPSATPNPRRWPIVKLWQPSCRPSTVPAVVLTFGCPLKVSEAVAEQIATAQVNGQKFPARLMLPPPPRPYDRQLIQSFIPYLFTNTYEGAPVPEIRFTSDETDTLH